MGNQPSRDVWQSATSSPPRAQPHPNARPLTSPLRTRPKEKEQSIVRLIGQMRHWVEFAAEITLKTKPETINSLNNIRISGTCLTLFIPEEYISLAAFKIHDLETLQRLLDQEWVQCIDFSELIFGNPSAQ